MADYSNPRSPRQSQQPASQKPAPAGTGNKPAAGRQTPAAPRTHADGRSTMPQYNLCIEVSDPDGGEPAVVTEQSPETGKQRWKWFGSAWPNSQGLKVRINQALPPSDTITAFLLVSTERRPAGGGK